jgi:hypothetical protein
LMTARRCRLVLLRPASLGITNAFALLWQLPGGDRDKDAQILALGHQLAVLQRQLDGQRVRFDPADRAWLAVLPHRLPKSTLHSLRLLVRPDTVLRWHRDLVARRRAAASRPRRPGRPPTVGGLDLPSLVIQLDDLKRRKPLPVKQCGRQPVDSSVGAGGGGDGDFTFDGANPHARDE